MNAAGKVQAMYRLDLTCKVEGIDASVSGDRLDLLMVTDADDRETPALLLSATLNWLPLRPFDGSVTTSPSA